MLCYLRNHYIRVYYLNHLGNIFFTWSLAKITSVYFVEIYKFLLLLSYRLESFKSTTNPWIGTIEEQIIIGNSGQSINDIIKATGETNISPIEWLEKTLLWRHICPTAPDTLLACPYYENDLFIMKECPNIYFVGNTDKFETKLWKGLCIFLNN